jgi:hypothetical protein
VQHDPRDLAPVGAARIGIEHAEIRDEMLLVVPRERLIGRHEIGDIGIEGRLPHGVQQIFQTSPNRGGVSRFATCETYECILRGWRLPVQWRPRRKSRITLTRTILGAAGWGAGIGGGIAGLSGGQCGC